jgi:hypothetical protein
MFIGQLSKYIIVYPIEAVDVRPDFLSHGHTFVFTGKQLFFIRTDCIGVGTHRCVHVTV